MLKSKGSTLPGYGMSALFVLEGVFISYLGSMLRIRRLQL